MYRYNLIIYTVVSGSFDERKRCFIFILKTIWPLRNPLYIHSLTFRLEEGEDKVNGRFSQCANTGRNIFVRRAGCTYILDAGRVASAHAILAEALGDGVGLGGAGRVRVALRRHSLSRCYHVNGRDS